MTANGKRPGSGARGTSPGESSRRPRSARDSRTPVEDEEYDLPEPEPRLIRGYQRLRLLKDLATAPTSLKDLARTYDLPVEELQTFRDEHETEIAELAAAFTSNLPIETQGMWITHKSNRLAEMEHEAEAIRDALEDYREQGISWSRAHRDMIRTYLEILHSVADELGAYPQRQSAPARSGSTVHYVIDTESTEELQ